ncbi:D-alanyl-D-alanine carboxypeptidase family protein [Halobacillus yeomjeoni]|uniref:D-alanyl-D-alanine carboxypeptidase family protein n=1 Tax=Halobacillus yeomjeoni TaxID=311194 RepID=UPI001A7E9F4E|nr:D-alanyl-D-alanine carboxypeptidase family protein [Halobacillus yeomjeoni]
MKKIVLFITTYLIITIASAYPTEAEEKPSTPIINSESAIVLEANTGKVIYEKYADSELYPASLTKIATAIYAIETGDLEDSVTVSKNAYETKGSSVYLKEGDEVKLRQLVEGLMINSGNDAGVAIAEHLSGSVDEFSEDINEYLKEIIGVENTTFKNPHGLFDPGHTTTAEDLAEITQYAMKNSTFNEIYSTKKMEWKSESWDATLYTHHKLMREDPYEGVTGGKTGYVRESGFTLATTASRENTTLIVITMKSDRKQQVYEDTKDLLDYGFENYETTSFAEGTTFVRYNNQYRVPETVHFTHLKEEPINYEVNKTGEMTFFTYEGEALTTIQLLKVSPLLNHYYLPFTEWSVKKENLRAHSETACKGELFLTFSCLPKL